MNREKRKHIKTIVRCPNDMVMVFDKKGVQIPEYQGQYHAVKESILKDASQNAVFGYLSDSEPELHEVPKEKW